MKVAIETWSGKIQEILWLVMEIKGFEMSWNLKSTGYDSFQKIFYSRGNSPDASPSSLKITLKGKNLLPWEQILPLMRHTIFK